MKIVINDANILIDLVELKLLPYFFRLDFEFRTTELILNELFPEQKEDLIPFIEAGELIVDTLYDDDFEKIITLMDIRPGLSEQDCSALLLAQSLKSVLITSDNAMRKFVILQNIEVHGHLWVFDKLVDGGILPGSRAIEKLEKLRTVINPKLGLPENECKRRIGLWDELD